LNLSGTISGPYCNNTMVDVDQCALNSTELNTDLDPNQNITSIKCNYLGNRQTTTLTFSNVWIGDLAECKPFF